jgi:hypothetical protein
MIIVRLLLPSLFGWFGTTKVYSGVGADIVMESITLTDRIFPALAVRRNPLPAASDDPKGGESSL